MVSSSVVRDSLQFLPLLCICMQPRSDLCIPTCNLSPWCINSSMGTPLIILDSSSWSRTALHWWPSGPVIECLDVTDGWLQSSLYLAPAPGITPSWLQHPALHPALHHPDLLTAAQCQLLCGVCPMCPPANAHNWLWWREEWQNYPDITG